MSPKSVLTTSASGRGALRHQGKASTTWKVAGFVARAASTTSSFSIRCKEQVEYTSRKKVMGLLLFFWGDLENLLAVPNHPKNISQIGLFFGGWVDLEKE